MKLKSFIFFLFLGSLIPLNIHPSSPSSLVQSCKAVLTNKYVLGTAGIAATTAFLRLSPYDVLTAKKIATQYLPEYLQQTDTFKGLFRLFRCQSLRRCIFGLDEPAYPPHDLELYLNEKYKNNDIIEVPRHKFEEIYQEMLRIQNLKRTFYQKIKNIISPLVTQADTPFPVIIKETGKEYVQVPKKLLVRILHNIDRCGFIIHSLPARMILYINNHTRFYANEITTFWSNDANEYWDWKRKKSEQANPVK